LALELRKPAVQALVRVSKHATTQS
jgi:hypothetical protein